MIVDPDARLLIVDKPGFNQIKTELATNSRKGKANALRQCRYDTIIFGASTAETAITQQHPVMKARNFYNASLRGGSMYEMRRIVEYALQHQSLEIVVLGLDFTTFSSRIIYLEDFADSPLGESIPIDSLGRYLFSLRTLGNSIQTLKSNVQGDAAVAYCSDNGEHKKNYESEEARKTFDFILRSYARNQYGNYITGDLHFRNLATLLQELRTANVTVYAFISPAHVIHNQLIVEMGLLDEYEGWKRQLAKIFADVNNGKPGLGQVLLWDFSGYNAINMEKIPAVNSGVYLHWYSDPLHFEPKVGNIILDKMLGLPAREGESMADFGVLLTPANVEVLLEKERRDSERFRRENPEEIAHLQNLLRNDSLSAVAVAF